MEVARYVITTRSSEDETQAFNGGDYHYGTTEFRDYWTGEMYAQYQWTSADFPFCPIWGNFGCSCQGEHTMLQDKIDTFHVVETLYVKPGGDMGNGLFLDY